MNWAKPSTWVQKPEMKWLKSSLEDLESDLRQPDKQQPKRIQRRIAALWAVALALGASIVGTVGFSNDVLELAEKLGIPIELNQLPPGE